MPVIGTGGSPLPGTGNSTKTLQSVVDYTRSIGDLSPVFATGGFSNTIAMEIGNDVMTEMFAAPMNWKWNRIIIPPFYTVSVQQDYATVNQGNIGWLERAYIIDINNSMVPKPQFWLECKKDLPTSSYFFGQPFKICWMVNETLVQGAWPGAVQRYTNPLGAATTPINPPTNILDASGNILVLTTYGVTGNAAPNAGANPVTGALINDGSCVWTVAGNRAQGFRLAPMPGQSTLVWQVNVVAQAKPRTFTNLSNTLDPIPDDASKYFRDGFIAYAHRHSTNPEVKKQFPEKRAQWLAALMEASGAAAREREDAAIIPATSIMGQPGTMPAGPAWPWGSNLS